MNTFEESRGIFAQHGTSYKATVLCPAQFNREVTPSSGKEAPSNVTIHGAKEGVMGGKKRCKNRPQGTTMTTTTMRRLALA
jgi:hypothetical protein